MSNDKVLSESTSAPTVKRRVQVGRRTSESLNKRLEGARMEEALESQREIMDGIAEARVNELTVTHDLALTEAQDTAHANGVTHGKILAMENYESMLDESVDNRLCDNDRDIPWPVGVMMAGEQHRILQALAEWVECEHGFHGNPEQLAQAFARHLGIIHFPENLDAPSAPTYRNCKPPPKAIDRDQKGKQMELEHNECKLPGYTEHWQYYLRQLDDKG